MIDSGFSLLGLSEVMTTTSARSLATRAHDRAFGPVPVTTGTENDDHTPRVVARTGLVGKLARRLQRLAERSRSVGEVDQHD